jgi:hypothetical protein
MDEHDVDAETALYHRYEDAVLRANRLQSSLYAAAVAAGVLVPTAASEDVLAALLSDRAEPLVDVRTWEEAVPLVLIVTDYAPYTTIPAPQGHVVWIDPSEEGRYVASLAALGGLDQFTTADA